MEASNTYDILRSAEGMLVAGRNEDAEKMLVDLADELATYVEGNCEVTDEVQWFSFPSPFERLAYRHVEKDPRELRDVGEPIDRVYSDLAIAEIRLGDLDNAAAALKLAIRWNPMECSYRLDLAEICRIQGDMQEYLALSYSVFERASKVDHLVRAFLNFAQYFAQTGNPEAQAACLFCALRADSENEALQEIVDSVTGTPADPAGMDESRAAELLAQEGLPTGASADIAVCLLSCAADAADEGDNRLAIELTVRARDLVGSSVAGELLKLIRSEDAGREVGE